MTSSERSGSVVECLTRDRGAAGLSRTGVTVLCTWARTIILANYWFNPGRPVSLWLKVCWWDVKNQIKQTNKDILWTTAMSYDRWLFVLCWFKYGNCPLPVKVCLHLLLVIKQYNKKRWHDYHILTYLIWALWVHATYLFTECVTKSCDPPNWLIQTCYQSASSCVTETTFLTWHVSKNVLV